MAEDGENTRRMAHDQDEDDDFNLPMSMPAHSRGQSTARFDTNVEGTLQSKGNVFLHRIAICCLAVVLLWCTTLGVANEIAVLYFPAPPMQRVVDGWYTVMNVTQDQENRYSACAVRELGFCNLRYQAAVQAEDARAQQNRTFNNLVLASEHDASILCVAAAGETAATAKTWNEELRKAGGGFLYNTSCTAAELEYVQEFLFKDVAAQSADLFTEYSLKIEAVFGKTNESLANRTAYDSAYLARKFASVIDLSEQIMNLSLPNLADIDAAFDFTLPVVNLQTCLNSKKGCLGNAPTFNSLVDDYQGFVDSWNATLKTMAATWALGVAQATAYSNTIKGMLENVEGFYSSLRSIRDGIRGLGVDIDLAPDITFRPFTGLGSIPPIPNIPSFESFMNAKVPPLMATLTQAASQTKQRVMEQAQEWADEINITGVEIPKVAVLTDYNPPPVDIDTTEFGRLTDSYHERISNLGKFNITFKPIDINMGLGSNVSFAFKSGSKFHFESFGGQLAFQPLDAALSAIFWFALIADYFFRAYRSASLVVKFWGGSAQGLPVVDVRQFKTTKKTPTRLKVARFVTHPVVLYGSMATIAGIGLIVLAAAYIPLYNQYMAGCVNGNNGTILTRNAYSLVYNYASSDGNSKLVDGLDDYDTGRAAKCGQEAQKSTADTKTMNDQQKTYVTDRVSAGRQMQLTVQCINPATFTPGRVPGVNASALPPITPIQATVGLETCATNPALPMRRMEYNCANLPLCVTPCDGPNQQRLRFETHKTGCDTEWLFHASVFRSLLAVVVYVSMNISRSLLIGSVCRLCWRSLTPVGFTFMGSCSRSGKLASYVHSKLEKAVRQSVRQYEQWAWFGLFMTIVSQLPYIIIAAVFSDNLQPAEP